MSASEIVSHEYAHSACIELNRPKALNALTLDMIENMHALLDQWQQDDNIQIVIIRSNHPKAYCAGGDIRQIFANQSHGIEQQMQFFEREYQLNLRLSTYPKPIVPILNGITMGGGIGISLHASNPVATNAATLAMPETAIGFFPDIGASYLLSRLPHHIGIFLALTGYRLNAMQALALKLVSVVIDSKQLESYFEALCAIESKPDLSDINQSYQLKEVSLEDLQDDLFQIRAIERCFAEPTIEGILKQLEQSRNQWSDAILSLLAQHSPLSLTVTLEQMQRAQKLNLSDCLQQDRKLARLFMKSKDFYEGVRAMVVDKDKQPRWQYPNIQALPSDLVQTWFEGECENI